MQLSWNYNYTIAEMLILLVIFAYFLVRSKPILRRNQIYFGLLVSEILVLALDVSGAYAIEHWSAEHPALVTWINTVFFVMYFTRCLFFFLFTLEIMGISRRSNRVLAVTLGSYLGLELVALAEPFTHWMFGISEQGFYRGPLYDLIYVQFGCYLLVTLHVLWKKRRQADFSCYRGIILYWGILLVGNVVRAFATGYLIMNIFCLMAILVIFLSFTDPVAFIDGKTRLYNERGLVEYLTENLGKRSFYLVACVIKNKAYLKEIYTTTDMAKAMRQIADSLKKQCEGCTGFYMNGGYFVFLGTQEIPVEKFRAHVSKLFEYPWISDTAAIQFSPAVIACDSKLGFASLDEFSQNLQTAVERVYEIDAPDYLSREEFHRQMKVRKALKRSIDEKDVRLYLQPIVDATSLRVVGAEALARLEDPELGVISPGEFISYAESNGSITDLGSQMFEKSCKFMQEYQKSLGLEWINVNLSPIQCMNPNLAMEFAEILERYQVSPDKIHLEITEETMIDAHLMAEQMERLQKVGFQFALDDYGSGYANISMLAEYPLATVKIDRSLINSYFKHSNAVLPGTLQTFVSLGYHLVAEGVEEAVMIEVLRSMGCHYLQGYYFSKPLPYHEFLEKYQKLS